MSDELSSILSSTTTTSSTGLSDVFKNTINNILAIEKQPLVKATAKRDSLKEKISAYEKIAGLLESLHSSVSSLYASGAYSSLSYSRMATVKPYDADKTVASVTAGSGAVTGKYTLSVTNLAVAEQHISNIQPSTSTALGYTGTFSLGGTGTAATSISSDTSSVLSSVSLGSVYGDFSELGTGDYSIQTRNSGGTLQFRLVDADGEAVEIKNSKGELTTDWTTYTAGTTYDTGRGLVLNLSGATGSDAKVSYTAKGVTVVVTETDTLVDIADKINSANQPEGREINATIVGKQLILTAEHTGTNHKMVQGVTYSENIAGLDFSTTGEGTKAAEDATFTVNGVSFTTQSNTGLTNVINGTVINLAEDSEGQTATINITKDTKGVQEKIEKFVSAFNEVVSYIQESTAITEDTVNNTYTRSVLANDTIFKELRSTLFDTILSQYSNSGTFTMLSELGITIDDNLVLSVSDTDLLTSALEDNFDSVVSLLDKAMGSFNTTLSRFTRIGGYLDSASDSLDSEYLDLSENISNMQTSLINRKSQLTDMYAEMQSEMLILQYSYQSWQSIYSNTVSFLS